MSKEYAMSLAKVIVLMAWADGELHKNEKKLLESLLKQFPELGEREQAIIRLYMEYRLGSGEERAIINEFLSLCRTNQERDYAMKVLNKMAKADGTINERERKIYKLLEAQTQKNTGFMSKFKKKPSATSTASMGRERDLDRYLDNPIYFILKKHSEEIEMHELGNLAQLKSLTVFAGIVSAVIQSDNDIDPDECLSLKSAIEKNWHITGPVAWRLVDVILKHEVTEGELERYCNNFLDIHTSDEVIVLFKLLVDVVKADGDVQMSEQKMLRFIGEKLHIDNETLKAIMPARKLNLSKLKKAS